MARIQAIQLLAQGCTKAQVANILQVTEASIYGWQKDYREGGLAALSTKIASGRKRLLTDAQNAGAAQVPAPESPAAGV
jgi:transposase